MMLKGFVGLMATGCGSTPSGASQSSNTAPRAAPPRSMGCTPGGSASSKGEACSSTKTNAAPESATMAPNCAGVTEGAIGAGTAAARSVPRPHTACSTPEPAQLATAWPGSTPSRCKAAATRSTRRSRVS